jgi:hypothetical protein
VVRPPGSSSLEWLKLPYTKWGWHGGANVDSLQILNGSLTKASAISVFSYYQCIIYDTK